ncbi:MGDG synthase family glycosyltransferase [Niallia sp. Krafla_26]|uniref:MGDG synthase family glycosyltransferase n=1 Tax=Niallia sp. Krafla_26 TaxID=3064703 RepID=UPI003D17F8B9
MNEKPTVLILTAKYGSGHMQAAQVLANELNKRGYSIIISDLFEESYPSFSQMTQQLLIKSYIYGQTFYKWFYYGTNKLNHKGLIQFSQYLGKKRLLHLIQQYKPSFIVTTFPIHVAPALVKKGRLSIPVYTVITDYCVHPYWINSLIDHYFVASDEVKNAVMQLGVDEKRITVSGIPIRRDFEKDVNHLTLYQKYNLDESKPIITIFAGAYGVLKGVKELATGLLEMENIQIIIICGKNKDLYTKLFSLTKNDQNTLRLYSYVEKIHELFSISSCLITKPGGITLTEACALHIPMILYRPIPGQELENAHYFKKHQAAYITYSSTETIKITKQIIETPSIATNMKLNLRNLYYPNASTIIIDHILHQSLKPMMSKGGN